MATLARRTFLPRLSFLKLFEQAHELEEYRIYRRAYGARVLGEIPLTLPAARGHLSEARGN